MQKAKKINTKFIVLFGAILRMRNLLSSFDEFAGAEILSDRDFQDYLGRYQDLRDEWQNRKPGGEKEDITDDIVFEIELIKQIENFYKKSNRCTQFFQAFFTLLFFHKSVIKMLFLYPSFFIFFVASD